VKNKFASREIFDYMCGSGFSIREPSDAREGRAFVKRAPVPDWMREDQKVQEFLRQQFPHMGTTAEYDERVLASPRETQGQKLCRERMERQRDAAGRWARVIKNFLTGAESTRDIEVFWLHDKRCHCVTRLAQRIRLAAKGFRQDGLPRTGRPRGRPKGSVKRATELNDGTSQANGAEHKVSQAEGRE
jgi:hypothetical protein